MGDTLHPKNQDSEYLYPLSLQWNDSPERLKKLKNKLLLYFQKRSESNGGDCMIRDTDCSQGYVLIHFRDDNARYRVLQKEKHLLRLSKEVELNLKISLPNTGGPSTVEEFPESVIGLKSGHDEDRDSEDKTSQDNMEAQVFQSSVVLIENVRDSCTHEMLILLVESYSDKNGDTDFNVEIFQEIQSAVVTFTCDIDIPLFIRTFSNSLRVVHHKLTARPLEECQSIRVENLPDNTSENHLAAFFESSRQRGGKVKELMMLPEERAALITFHDAEDVQRILKKEHVFSKKKISVYPYYPLLNVALYGKQGPCIEIPKQIEFNISPFILQHICNTEGLKNNIDVKMRNNHCEITWPNEDSQNPILQLTFSCASSTDLKTMAKIVPNWSEKVYSEFSFFIAKFRVIDYEMDESVWEALREDVSSPTYDGVLIKPHFDLGRVFMAGMSKDVTKIDPMFRQLIEETTKKVERKKQSKTETLTMSPALYQMMHNSGLQKKILNKVPELNIGYDIPTKKARLSGLTEEVLTAKCEILSIKQYLKSKSVQMNPHLIQFLMSTDFEELSCQLFINHNINALLEIDDSTVKLVACSEEDLTAAQKTINEKLLHKEIFIEDESLLKTPEWERLHSYLLQLFDKSNCKILIQQSFPETNANVVIAGLSLDVQKCDELIIDFLEKNTVVKREIAVQAPAMMRFIWEEKKEILENIKTNVKVTMNPKSISLSGSRMKVQDAEKVIKSLLNSLHYDTLRIEKPGAKRFCKINEKTHVTTVLANFQCVICLEEVGVEDNLLGKAQFQTNLPNGMILAVYKDNLCHHNVDVIVNAANEDLKHIGGLAKAILDAAGHKLQDDCNQIIKKDGKLSTGDSIITDAGKLPCKQVIHTVGPRWDANARSRCERLLRRAITTSLQLASEKNHSSIAIPAVSSGVFGFPLKLCAESIVEAIQDFVEMPEQQSTLQRIHLVDTKDDILNFFSDVAKAKFGNQMDSVPSTAKLPEKRTRVPKKTQTLKSKGSDNTVVTKEGLMIKLLQKSIEDCSADVIVNSVGDHLNLNNGAVSIALLNRAGIAMQQLLNDASVGTAVAPGSMFSTSGCNLNCQEVLHVVTPAWDSGKGTSETILRTIIKNCLALTEQNNRTSISFPAIGTGVLGFPKDLVALVMFDEVLQFSCRNKVQNLKEVHLVLHPKDVETIKAFTNQLANCTGSDTGKTTNRQSTTTGSTFFGTVTTPSLGVHEMKIGPVSFQVKTGDITKEQSDVIVNSSNQNFTLQTGVSKAILDAAGPTVVSTAAALGLQAHPGYVITGPGNLTQCQSIIHVEGPKQADSIKKMVLNILQACENQQASSVTLPALGTGAGKLSANMVADSILDALEEFIMSKSVSSLQTVTVVLFQQQMQNDFYTSMKKKEGTALQQANQTKSLLSRFTEFFKPPKAQKKVQKLTAFQLVDGIEPVIFSLCAENKSYIDKAKTYLQEQIEYEQAVRVIQEECIPELDEADMQKISDLQKKFQVSVIYKPTDPSIRIQGLTRDVLAVSGEIETIVKKAKDTKNKERAAELTSNLVEWRYESSGGNMVPFDKMTNLKLEEAKIDNETQVKVHIQKIKYIVNINTETATDDSGNRIRVQRAVKHKGDSLDLPTHWKSMGKNLVIEVDVLPGMPEYSDVQKKFQRTCGNSIVKILRVQNKDLWLNYQIKKQNFDSKNASTNNERELFHGTDSNSIQHVNHNGFNRSYAGRNAAAIGNGTYFAVNANYSANRTFAKPDANQQQHMYLARVLTGEYCQGQRGMITPPAKNVANVTNLYDSVTDNIHNPSMFVIFNDIQAYPEYHIVFQ